MKHELLELGIDEITVKSQVREDLGDIDTLSASIAKLGLLVPVIVARDNALICGARRLAACRRAGLSRIDVVRLDIACDSMSALDVRVDRTLCREPLTSEDLDKLIQMKKSMAEGNGAQPGGWTRVRKFFQRKAR